MREVRKLLRNERWLSKYVVIGPLKGPLDTTRYDPEETYMRNAVYTVINAEWLREKDIIFPYLFYLHSEHVKRNLRR